MMDVNKERCFKFEDKSFGIEPSAPIMIGITNVLSFQHLESSIFKSTYLSSFSTDFWAILASPGIAISIK